MTFNVPKKYRRYVVGAVVTLVTLMAVVGFVNRGILINTYQELLSQAAPNKQPSAQKLAADKAKQDANRAEKKKEKEQKDAKAKKEADAKAAKTNAASAEINRCEVFAGVGAWDEKTKTCNYKSEAVEKAASEWVSNAGQQTLACDKGTLGERMIGLGNQVMECRYVNGVYRFDPCGESCVPTILPSYMTNQQPDDAKIRGNTALDDYLDEAKSKAACNTGGGSVPHGRYISETEYCENGTIKNIVVSLNDLNTALLSLKEDAAQLSDAQKAAKAAAEKVCGQACTEEKLTELIIEAQNPIFAQASLISLLTAKYQNSDNKEDDIKNSPIYKEFVELCPSCVQGNLAETIKAGIQNLPNVLIEKKETDALLEDLTVSVDTRSAFENILSLNGANYEAKAKLISNLSNKIEVPASVLLGWGDSSTVLKLIEDFCPKLQGEALKTCLSEKTINPTRLSMAITAAYSANELSIQDQKVQDVVAMAQTPSATIKENALYKKYQGICGGIMRRLCTELETLETAFSQMPKLDSIEDEATRKLLADAQALLDKKVAERERAEQAAIEAADEVKDPPAAQKVLQSPIGIETSEEPKVVFSQNLSTAPKCGPNQVLSYITGANAFICTNASYDLKYTPASEPYVSPHTLTASEKLVQCNQTCAYACAVNSQGYAQCMPGAAVSNTSGLGFITSTADVQNPLLFLFNGNKNTACGGANMPACVVGTQQLIQYTDSSKAGKACNDGLVVIKGMCQPDPMEAIINLARQETSLQNAPVLSFSDFLKADRGEGLPTTTNPNQIDPQVFYSLLTTNLAADPRITSDNPDWSSALCGTCAGKCVSNSQGSFTCVPRSTLTNNDPSNTQMITAYKALAKEVKPAGFVPKPNQGDLGQQCADLGWHYLGDRYKCNNELLSCNAQGNTCELSEAGQVAVAMGIANPVVNDYIPETATIYRDALRESIADQKLVAGYQALTTNSLLSQFNPATSAVSSILNNPKYAAAGCVSDDTPYQHNGACFICLDSASKTAVHVENSSCANSINMAALAASIPGKACHAAGGYCAKSSGHSEPELGNDKCDDARYGCYLNTPSNGKPSEKSGLIILGLNESFTGSYRETCDVGLVAVDGQCKEESRAAFVDSYKTGGQSDRQNNDLDAPSIQDVPVIGAMWDHAISPLIKSVSGTYYAAAGAQADFAISLTTNYNKNLEAKVDEYIADNTSILSTGQDTYKQAYLAENGMNLNSFVTSNDIDAAAKVLVTTKVLDSQLESKQNPLVKIPFTDSYVEIVFNPGANAYRNLAQISLFTSAYTEDLSAGLSTGDYGQGFLNYAANPNAQNILALSGEIIMVAGDVLTPPAASDALTTMAGRAINRRLTTATAVKVLARETVEAGLKTSFENSVQTLVKSGLKSGWSEAASTGLRYTAESALNPRNYVKAAANILEAPTTLSKSLDETIAKALTREGGQQTATFTVKNATDLWESGFKAKAVSVMVATPVISATKIVGGLVISMGPSNTYGGKLMVEGMGQLFTPVGKFIIEPIDNLLTKNPAIKAFVSESIEKSATELSQSIQTKISRDSTEVLGSLSGTPLYRDFESVYGRPPKSVSELADFQVKLQSHFVDSISPTVNHLTMDSSSIDAAQLLYVSTLTGRDQSQALLKLLEGSNITTDAVGMLKAQVDALAFAREAGIVLDSTSTAPFLKTYREVAVGFVENGRPLTNAQITEIVTKSVSSPDLPWVPQMQRALTVNDHPFYVGRNIWGNEVAVVASSTLNRRLNTLGLQVDIQKLASGDLATELAAAKATKTGDLAFTTTPVKVEAVVVEEASSLTPPHYDFSSFDAMLSNEKVSLIRQSDEAAATVRQAVETSGGTYKPKNAAYRLEIPSSATEELATEVRGFNTLLDDFETTVGFHLDEGQVATLLDGHSIIKMEAGGGKTDVIMRVLSAKDGRGLAIMSKDAEALDFINKQVLPGRDFYEKRATSVVFLDAQRGPLRVDLSANVFDVKSGIPVPDAEFGELLVRAQNGEAGILIVTSRAPTGWTYMAGKKVNSFFDRLFGRSSPQSSQAFSKIIEGGYGKFTILADEIGDDITGSLAISGKAIPLAKVTKPKDVMGLRNGKEAIRLHGRLGEIEEVRQLRSVVQSQVADNTHLDHFVYLGKGQVAPKDATVHARSLAGVVDSVSGDPSLARALQREPAFATKLTDFSQKLRGVQTEDELKPLLTEFENFLSTSPIGSSQKEVLTELTFMKQHLQDTWKQLSGVPNTHFGMQGSEVVLFKAGGSTGERLSTVSQLMAFYEETPILLQKAGIDTSNLKPVDFSLIGISKQEDQLSIRKLYETMLQSGHDLRAFDATPDTAAHMLSIAASGESEIITKKPSWFSAHSDKQRLLADFHSHAEVGKAQAVVLAGKDTNYQLVTEGLTGNQTKHVAVARYTQMADGETVVEYLRLEKQGGTWTVGKNFATQGEWDDFIHAQLKVDPNELLVVYQGRVRAVDLSVSQDNLKLQWSVFAESGTDVEQITQSIKRNRLLVKRQQDGLLALNTTQSEIDLANRYGLYVETDVPLRADTAMDHFYRNHQANLAQIRLDNAIRSFGEARKTAIEALRSNLDEIAGTSGVFNFRRNRISSYLDSMEAEAERLRVGFDGELSRTPLTDPDGIASEIYLRGQKADESLRQFLRDLSAQVGIGDDEAMMVARAWGIDLPFPTRDEFLALFDSPVSSMVERGGVGPAYETLLWAKNNGKQATNPLFEAPETAWLNKTDQPALSTPLEDVGLLAREATPEVPPVLPPSPSLTPTQTQAIRLLTANNLPALRGLNPDGTVSQVRSWLGFISAIATPTFRTVANLHEAALSGTLDVNTLSQQLSDVGVAGDFSQALSDLLIHQNIEAIAARSQQPVQNAAVVTQPVAEVSPVEGKQMTLADAQAALLKARQGAIDELGGRAALSPGELQQINLRISSANQLAQALKNVEKAKQAILAARLAAGQIANVTTEVAEEVVAPIADQFEKDPDQFITGLEDGCSSCSRFLHDVKNLLSTITRNAKIVKQGGTKAVTVEQAHANVQVALKDLQTLVDAEIASLATFPENRNQIAIFLAQYLTAQRVALLDGYLSSDELRELHHSLLSLTQAVTNNNGQSVTPSTAPKIKKLLGYLRAERRQIRETQAFAGFVAETLIFNGYSTPTVGGEANTVLIQILVGSTTYSDDEVVEMLQDPAFIARVNKSRLGKEKYNERYADVEAFLTDNNLPSELSFIDVTRLASLLKKLTPRQQVALAQIMKSNTVSLMNTVALGNLKFDVIDFVLAIHPTTFVFDVVTGKVVLGSQFADYDALNKRAFTLDPEVEKLHLQNLKDNDFINVGGKWQRRSLWNDNFFISGLQTLSAGYNAVLSTTLRPISWTINLLYQLIGNYDLFLVDVTTPGTTAHTLYFQDAFFSPIFRTFTSLFKYSPTQIIGRSVRAYSLVFVETNYLGYAWGNVSAQGLNKALVTAAKTYINTLAIPGGLSNLGTLLHTPISPQTIYSTGRFLFSFVRNNTQTAEMIMTTFREAKSNRERAGLVAVGLGGGVGFAYIETLMPPWVNQYFLFPAESGLMQLIGNIQQNVRQRGLASTPLLRILEAFEAGVSGSFAAIGIGNFNQNVGQIGTVAKSLFVEPPKDDLVATEKPVEVQPTENEVVPPPEPETEIAHIPTKTTVDGHEVPTLNRPPNLLVVGDSQTYSLPKNLAYRLDGQVNFVGSVAADDLGNGVPVMFEGHMGFGVKDVLRDLTDGIWNDYPQSRVPETGLEYSSTEYTPETMPDIIVIQLGTNDALHGAPPDFGQNITDIINHYRNINPHVQIILNQIPSVNSGVYSSNPPPNAIADGALVNRNVGILNQQLEVVADTLPGVTYQTASVTNGYGLSDDGIHIIGGLGKGNDGTMLPGAVTNIVDSLLNEQKGENGELSLAISVLTPEPQPETNSTLLEQDPAVELITADAKETAQAPVVEEMVADNHVKIQASETPIFEVIKSYQVVDEMGKFTGLDTWESQLLWKEKVLPDLEINCAGADCINIANGLVHPNAQRYALKYQPWYEPADLIPDDPSDRMPVVKVDVAPPGKTAEEIAKYYYEFSISQRAVPNLEALIEHANQVLPPETKLVVTYGYRSYEKQSGLSAGRSEDVASAGYSDHQSGLAVDFGILDENGNFVTDRAVIESTMLKVREFANDYGVVYTYRTDAVHFVVLDGYYPGLTKALIDAGINPNDKDAVTNAIHNLHNEYLDAASQTEKVALSNPLPKQETTREPVAAVTPQPDTALSLEPTSDSNKFVVTKLDGQITTVTIKFGTTHLSPENIQDIKDVINKMGMFGTHLPANLVITKVDDNLMKSAPYRIGVQGDKSIQITLSDDIDDAKEKSALTQAIVESLSFNGERGANYSVPFIAFYNLFYLGKGGVDGDFFAYDPNQTFEESSQFKQDSTYQTPKAAAAKDFAISYELYLNNPTKLQTEAPYRYHFFRLIESGQVNPLDVVYVLKSQNNAVEIVASDKAFISDKEPIVSFEHLGWDQLPQKLTLNNRDYKTQAEASSAKYNVPIAIVVGVMERETGVYQNRNQLVSEADAVGVMQVVPKYGFTAKQLEDKTINIDVGTRLLKEIYEDPELGNHNWRDTLMIYNVGGYDILFKGLKYRDGGYKYADDILELIDPSHDVAQNDALVPDEIIDLANLPAKVPDKWSDRVAERVPGEKENAWTDESRAWPIVDFAKIISFRPDPDVIRGVIDALNVTDPANARYQHAKDTGWTKCNIFVTDISRIIGYEIPHWWNGSEFSANQTVDWLADEGGRYGWETVDAKTAQDLANQGYPVVAAAHGAVGHIAWVVEGDLVNGYPIVAQAGAQNYDAVDAKKGFGADADIQYYVNRGDPYTISPDNFGEVEISSNPGDEHGSVDNPNTYATMLNPTIPVANWIENTKACAVSVAIPTSTMIAFAGGGQVLGTDSCTASQVFVGTGMQVLERGAELFTSIVYHTESIISGYLGSVRILEPSLGFQGSTYYGADYSLLRPDVYDILSLGSTTGRPRILGEDPIAFFSRFSRLKPPDPISSDLSESVRSTLEELGFIGHSLTISPGESESKKLDYLIDIITTGFWPAKGSGGVYNPTPYMTSFGKTGVRSSAGDFFTGYAVLLDPRINQLSSVPEFDITVVTPDQLIYIVPSLDVKKQIIALLEDNPYIDQAKLALLDLEQRMYTVEDVAAGRLGDPTLIPLLAQQQAEVTPEDTIAQPIISVANWIENTKACAVSVALPTSTMVAFAGGGGQVLGTDSCSPLERAVAAAFRLIDGALESIDPVPFTQFIEASFVQSGISILDLDSDLLAATLQTLLDQKIISGFSLAEIQTYRAEIAGLITDTYKALEAVQKTTSSEEVVTDSAPFSQSTKLFVAGFSFFILFAVITFVPGIFYATLAGLVLINLGLVTNTIRQPIEPLAVIEVQSVNPYSTSIDIPLDEFSTQLSINTSKESLAQTYATIATQQGADYQTSYQFFINNVDLSFVNENNLPVSNVNVFVRLTYFINDIVNQSKYGGSARYSNKKIILNLDLKTIMQYAAKGNILPEYNLPTQYKDLNSQDRISFLHHLANSVTAHEMYHIYQQQHQATEFNHAFSTGTIKSYLLYGFVAVSIATIFFLGFSASTLPIVAFGLITVLSGLFINTKIAWVEHDAYAFQKTITPNNFTSPFTFAILPTNPNQSLSSPNSPFISSTTTLSNKEVIEAQIPYSQGNRPSGTFAAFPIAMELNWEGALAPLLADPAIRDAVAQTVSFWSQTWRANLLFMKDVVVDFFSPRKTADWINTSVEACGLASGPSDRYYAYIGSGEVLGATTQTCTATQRWLATFFVIVQKSIASPQAISTAKPDYFSNLGSLVTVLRNNLPSDSEFYMYSSTAGKVFDPSQTAKDIDIQMSLSALPALEKIIHDPEVQRLLGIDPSTIKGPEGKRSLDVDHVSWNISFFMNGLEVDIWFDITKENKLLNYWNITLKDTRLIPISYTDFQGVTRVAYVPTFSPEDAVGFYRYVLRETERAIDQGKTVKDPSKRWENMRLIQQSTSVELNSTQDPESRVTMEGMSPEDYQRASITNDPELLSDDVILNPTIPVANWIESSVKECGLAYAPSSLYAYAGEGSVLGATTCGIFQTVVANTMSQAREGLRFLNSGGPPPVISNTVVPAEPAPYVPYSGAYDSACTRDSDCMSGKCARDLADHTWSCQPNFICSESGEYSLAYHPDGGIWWDKSSRCSLGCDTSTNLCNSSLINPCDEKNEGLLSWDKTEQCISGDWKCIPGKHRQPLLPPTLIQVPWESCIDGSWQYDFEYTKLQEATYSCRSNQLLKIPLFSSQVMQVNISPTPTLVKSCPGNTLCLDVNNSSATPGCYSLDVALRYLDPEMLSCEDNKIVYPATNQLIENCGVEDNSYCIGTGAGVMPNCYSKNAARRILGCAPGEKVTPFAGLEYSCGNDLSRYKLVAPLSESSLDSAQYQTLKTLKCTISDETVEIFKGTVVNANGYKNNCTLTCTLEGTIKERCIQEAIEFYDRSFPYCHDNAVAQLGYDVKSCPSGCKEGKCIEQANSSCVDDGAINPEGDGTYLLCQNGKYQSFLNDAVVTWNGCPNNYIDAHLNAIAPYADRLFPGQPLMISCLDSNADVGGYMMSTVPNDVLEISLSCGDPKSPWCKEVFIHESAHAYVADGYNDIDITVDSFVKAIGCRSTVGSGGYSFATEQPTSDYGATNCAEAFAEALTVYTGNDTWLTSSYDMGLNDYVTSGLSSSCWMKKNRPIQYTWFLEHDDSPFKGVEFCHEN